MYYRFHIYSFLNTTNIAHLQGVENGRYEEKHGQKQAVTKNENDV